MHPRRSALLITIALALTACAAPGGTTSPLPTGSGQAATPSPSDATVSPTATGSAGPSSEPPSFQNLALAVVLVDGLGVHTGPAASAPLLRRPAHMVSGGDEDVLIDAGDRVFVLGGGSGSYADDQWWFQVAIEEDARYTPAGLEVGVGWIAGGTAADPALREDNSFCNPSPSFSDIVEASRILRVGCYGSAPLTFDAYQASLPPDVGLGGACEERLRWLRCDNINYDYVNATGGPSFDLQLHFDPARGIAPTGLAPVGTIGPRWRITGHFDDPAAEGCPTDDVSSDAGRSAWLTCAAAFVVEAIQPLG